MKKMMFYLAAFLFFTSCTSINKLVESGDYDGAFELAVRKLEGKKKKKTEHVQGLERAFQKLHERDMERASRLIDQNSAANWAELHEIYNRMDFRQKMVDPLIPLRSKDGYRANFTFVKVGNLINEAAANAAEYEYNAALQFLARGREGDKEAAKNAYYLFDGVHRFVLDYKDANLLQDEAEYYGQTRVVVRSKNRSHAILPRGFEKRVLSLHTMDMNEKWTKYFLEGETNEPMDMVATLVINHLDVSPEREIVQIYDNAKEIEDGFEYKTYPNGKIVVDSTGTPIKIPVFKTIRARVTELTRTKSAVVSGKVHLKDLETGRRFRTEHIEVVSDFNDRSVRFTGDKRALENKWVSCLDNFIDPFPTDFAIIMTAAESLKWELKRKIKNII